MNKILILFAHPVFEKSRVHRILLQKLEKVEGITINDLYENYPEFDVDVRKEQQLLLSHDIIVWQHPFYWYSGPALLKQWVDLVLEHGWAYGKDGHALDGKRIFNGFTSGGGELGYQASGIQHCTVGEFLRPFERTAQLCRMIYLPPFWVPGTHRLNLHQMEAYGDQYRNLLITLRDADINNIKEAAYTGVTCQNELVTN